MGDAEGKKDGLRIDKNSSNASVGSTDLWKVSKETKGRVEFSYRGEARGEGSLSTEMSSESAILTRSERNRA